MVWVRRGYGTYHKLRIPRFIGQIFGRQSQDRAAQCVHVGLERGHLGGDLVRARETVAGRLVEGLVADVVGALGQDDAHDDLVVLHAFGRLRALEEGHLENVGVGGGALAEEAGEVVVPADAEAVVPAAENGETRAQLQRGVAARLPGAVAAGRDVADVVREVGVDGARLQREGEFADCGRGQLLEAADGPFDAGELVHEVGAVVAQPVALLGCQVAAPVRHFEITLQQRRGDDGFGELVAHADWVCGARGHLGRVVGTVGVGSALALGVGAGLEALRGGVLGHIGGGELQLGLLGHRLVGRGGVGGERIVEELLVGLLDGCGTGGERGEDGVRDAEGDLRFGS